MRCADCKWWRRRKPTESGLCSRYAPRPITVREGQEVEAPAVLWPTTYHDDGCGDFHIAREPVF